MGSAPATLRRLLDALSYTPLSDAAMQDARMGLARLDADRDELFEAIEAMGYVSTNLEALRWTDVGLRLAASEGLVPALRAQLGDAVAVKQAAYADEAAAREHQDTTSRAFHVCNAQLANAAERLNEATDRLAAVGVEEPSEALLEQAQVQASKLGKIIAEREHSLGEMQKNVGPKEAAVTVTTRYVTTTSKFEATERRAAQPVIEAWQRLSPQIEAAGLMTQGLGERLDREFARRGSVNLFPIAQEQRAVLFERLHTAVGGRDLLERTERLHAGGDMTGGDANLQIWLDLPAWLLSHLPAHIADVDEPLAALVRFRDHLCTSARRRAVSTGSTATCDGSPSGASEPSAASACSSGSAGANSCPSSLNGGPQRGAGVNVLLLRRLLDRPRIVGA